MSYYLKFDGYHGYISLPSMMFTKIEMQYSASPTYWQNYIDLAGDTSYRIQAQDGETLDLFASPDKWGGVINIDGTDKPIASGTNLLKKNTKTTVILNTAAVTGSLFVFSDASGFNNMPGSLYYVKLYNGTNLVAHYDMNTQTVQDQSGNGRHATLYGGEWLQEAQTGTPVQSDFAMKQSIYKTSQFDFPVKIEMKRRGGGMNLGEVKKRALSLMAEYSINGVVTPSSDNADYLVRMNGFAHDAQMEISEKVGIGASEIYSQMGTSGEGYNVYPLPPDFKQLRSVYHKDRIFNDYRIQNNNLMLSKALSGQFELIYFKNPTEITSETPDSYEFEVDKHTHHLIPYFVGGMAIHDENPSIADRLINMYFNRLNGTQKKLEDYPMDIMPVFSINNL